LVRILFVLIVALGVTAVAMWNNRAHGAPQLIAEETEINVR